MNLVNRCRGVRLDPFGSLPNVPYFLARRISEEVPGRLMHGASPSSAPIQSCSFKCLPARSGPLLVRPGAEVSLSNCLLLMHPCRSLCAFVLLSAFCPCFSVVFFLNSFPFFSFSLVSISSTRYRQRSRRTGLGRRATFQRPSRLRWLARKRRSLACIIPL